MIKVYFCLHFCSWIFHSQSHPNQTIKKYGFVCKPEVGFVMFYFESYSFLGHSGALFDGNQQSTSYAEQPLNLPPPGLQTTDDKQTVRHVMLCLLLTVSLLAVRMKRSLQLSVSECVS